MGLLDSNPLNVREITKIPHILERLADDKELKLYQYKYANNNNRVLGAVLRNVAAFFTNTAVYISTDGIDGELIQVELNSTNFPGLIEDSIIKEVMLIPYTRKTSSGGSVPYSGNSWRLCVFTSNGQIYHNFPSRAIGYDGASQQGDITKFDESVVWDLPNRKTPVKTDTGDAATLIGSGVYKYIPCYTDDAYTFYPSISTDNGYGNGGFGAVREYTDFFSKQTTKCPRFFFPMRGDQYVNPFRWMGGIVVDNQMSFVGTYQPSTHNNQGRRCVFATSDGGREWFVRYEFGALSSTKRKVGNDDWTIEALPAFSGEVVSWGTKSVSSGVFNVIKRWSYIPSTDDKNPEHKFVYEEPIAVSSITSDSSSIVVETVSAHNLYNGDTVLFAKQDSNANEWDWIASTGYTQDSAGDGNIWKAQVVDATHFKLRMEIHNPENQLACGHIHTLNLCKDGVVIGCGEEYPYGWILYISIRYSDEYSNMFAGNNYPVYRLTNTNKSIQRILGMEVFHDGSWICGMDTSELDAASTTLPNGDVMKRNSTGIFKGSINEIDNFAECDCVFETRDPAYFFKKVLNNLVFVGQRGTFAISKDNGMSWKEYTLPRNLAGARQLIGIDINNNAYIKDISRSDTLVIGFGDM